MSGIIAMKGVICSSSVVWIAMGLLIIWLLLSSLIFFHIVIIVMITIMHYHHEHHYYCNSSLVVNHMFFFSFQFLMHKGLLRNVNFVLYVTQRASCVQQRGSYSAQCLNLIKMITIPLRIESLILLIFFVDTWFNFRLKKRDLLCMFVCVKDSR